MLLFDAHPAGCARLVDELAAQAAVLRPGATPQRRPQPGPDHPVALIIGSSAGYGLAATVAALVHHGMRGVGVCYERPASRHRTATAGWYRAVGTATLAERLGADFTLVNGDCFGADTKLRTARLLTERYGRVDYLIYSVAAPESTAAIYRRGTIGVAKEHLERTAVDLTQGLLREHGGQALISVNGAAVTQASAAIPGVPLYISLLRHVLGDGMQSPAQQLMRLWDQLTGMAPLSVDDRGRIRLDDWELRGDVQRQVALARRLMNPQEAGVYASTGWLYRQLRRLYGFDVDGVDYAEPVEPDLPWPRAASASRPAWIRSVSHGS